MNLFSLSAWRHRLLRYYPLVALSLTVGITALLLVTLAALPPLGEVGNPSHNLVSLKYIEDGLGDTGALNIVAGMILDYRAFDTFGEACVLFTATCAIIILLRSDTPDAYDTMLHQMEEPHTNIILQSVSFLLVGIMLVFGCYVIANGHLSPGGGFSGGSILGAALILYVNSYGIRRASHFINFTIYRRLVSFSLLFYAAFKGYSFFMGANHLPSGIPLGKPGDLLSAGLILPLNIAVGCVVAGTVYAIYVLFSQGEMR
ncbi:MAG: hypothetical protein FWF06_00045 [Symbiobacteriaceae bacterium]|nr:hypothetical protein [Symbiobacteriaceae bacterium]